MSSSIYFNVGARPKFVKITPLINALNVNNLNYKSVHTGNHYDLNMSENL